MQNKSSEEITLNITFSCQEHSGVQLTYCNFCTNYFCHVCFFSKSDYLLNKDNNKFKFIWFCSARCRNAYKIIPVVEKLK